MVEREPCRPIAVWAATVYGEYIFCAISGSEGRRTMSNDMRAEINNLHADVAHLKARVAALELAARATDAPADAPAPAQRPRAGAYEPAVRPAPPAHAPQQRPVTAAAPSPPPRIAPRHVARVEWRTVGEQVFTARTLAWAGGVATTLGIVLLFVLAASRGWVTPPMRVAIGVAVSLGLLAAAVELDRRKWRADSILAAAGSGIAGLYACLWA